MAPPPLRAEEIVDELCLLSCEGPPFWPFCRGAPDWSASSPPPSMRPTFPLTLWSIFFSHAEQETSHRPYVNPSAMGSTSDRIVDRCTFARGANMLDCLEMERH
jgi:hypothetical protein